MAHHEALVRRTMVCGLIQAGYSVLIAADTTEARSLSHKYPGKVHLLLTDDLVPETGGYELAKSVMLDRPGTKVLLLSAGLSDSGDRVGSVRVLARSFTAEVLLATVAEMLDADATFSAADG